MAGQCIAAIGPWLKVTVCDAGLIAVITPLPVTATAAGLVVDAAIPCMSFMPALDAVLVVVVVVDAGGLHAMSTAAAVKITRRCIFPAPAHI